MPPSVGPSLSEDEGRKRADPDQSRDPRERQVDDEQCTIEEGGAASSSESPLVELLIIGFLGFPCGIGGVGGGDVGIEFLFYIAVECCTAKHIIKSTRQQMSSA